ncbi:MAG: thioredoxin domain-containing protein [Gemmatimonadetes bacterium]|uniref:Thioredoxin domain-containing protein n=1 Tax=Candidatus Kutchimonas denitrificans TaxID=3056748 RepID=A0AAE4ZBT1_9BACT|nr:thioredoxin domain-containing protein [Gemmatimonadota bacterium]NIR74590.1 thioredoxin domain-containing protein [Candidatus Kutchimonas denitrificans]NIS02780.1 thioredoxin domain-containing protein [Gemmatimonadota bacterium]NIT68941.1 thioredoxin domain-containing protein [Gemmatimonadota bacterium]NIV25209.1 thioredoxin domain-containing protein [Gemmatimonadota bacterium]
MTSISRYGKCLALATLPLIGCSQGGSQSDEVLVRIDGEPVRMTAVDSLVGDRLAQMERDYRQERQNLMEAALQRVVRDRLIEKAAAARGLTSAEFIAQEAADQVEVTEEDMVTFYRQNMAAMAGRSLEEIRPQLREYLETRELNEVLDSIGETLKETHDVVMLMEPIRADLSNEGSPALGPGNAPVTLTEFSDFECPYCRRFFDTLNRLKQEYEDQLRVVYRQYPLSTHPNAYKAAMASLCAHEQREFWAMHDILFLEQDSLGVEALKRKASRLGLNEEEFASCLESDRYATQIERDVQEADRLGITGTPFVFVNGVAVPGGAAPYDVMKEMIEEELARAER